MDFVCLLQCVVLQLVTISKTNQNVYLATIAVPYRYLHGIHITEIYYTAVIHVIHGIYIQLCMIIILLIVTFEVPLLWAIYTGESYSHQVSLIFMMLLKPVQWYLCVMGTLRPFISVLIIKVSWLSGSIYMFKHHLWP